MNKNSKNIQSNHQQQYKLKKTQKFNNMFTNHKQTSYKQHKDQSLLDQFQYNTHNINNHYIHNALSSKKSPNLYNKFQAIHRNTPESDNDLFSNQPYQNSQFEAINHPTKSYSNQSSQIVDHLINQNKNLKDHNAFLIQQIRKHRQKFKKYKVQIKQYRRKIQQLQHQNDVYKLQYLTVKEYVYQSLEKVQNQEQNQNSPSSIRRSQQMQQSTKLQRVNSVNTVGYESPNKHHQQDTNKNKSNQIIPAQPIKSIDVLVDQLNDQFDAMMYQYKSTKNLQSRRKCMQIAKKIRQLKKVQKETANQKKYYTQTNKNVPLPPHPNTAMSRKTLAYPPNKSQFSNQQHFEKQINKKNAGFQFRNSESQNNINKYLPVKKFGSSSERQYI